MTTPKHSGAYPEIRRIFDAALEKDGLRLTFSTPSQMHQFALRAHAFRACLRKENAELGMRPTSEYDDLKLSKNKKDNVIEIHIRSSLNNIEITDLNSNPVEFPNAEEEDDLIRRIRALDDEEE